MGSRYGGLKQLDGLGPNGETIMDYSIYDAIQAGFGKIVWVIRKDFEQDFREKILSKYEGHIPCELVFQSLDKIPEGYSVPEGRTKPWGTNHAVMMAKEVIHEPFCVINCDDFYNRDCFKVIGKFLSELPEDSKGKYAMVGFRVGNTLSDMVLSLVASAPRMPRTCSLVAWSARRSSARPTATWLIRTRTVSGWRLLTPLR